MSDDKISKDDRLEVIEFNLVNAFILMAGDMDYEGFIKKYPNQVVYNSPTYFIALALRGIAILKNE